MSDEVKQAAERMRLVNSGNPPLSIYGQFWSEEIAGDYAVVANAYLAEHANDAENVTLLTAEILQASRWVPSVAGTIWEHQMTRMQLRVDVNNWHVSVCGVRIGTVETVGDLRKLLEALHVPAVVVVPKGGG